MSCSRILIGRVVDGSSSEATVNVLVDKVFDWTASISTNSNSNKNSPSLSSSSSSSSTPPPPGTFVRQAWRRFRMEHGIDHGPQTLGVWRPVPKAAAPALRSALSCQQVPPPPALLEMVQVHATQNTTECIATVIIAFMAGAASTSTTLFQTACVFGAAGGAGAGGISRGNNNNNNNNAPWSFPQQLLASPSPNIDGACDELVSDVALLAQHETLWQNIRASIDPVLGNDGWIGKFARDPWLTLLGSSSNPSFAKLSDADTERIDGSLRPLLTQRLGFGCGSTYASRPLTFPLLSVAGMGVGGGGGGQQQGTSRGGGAGGGGGSSSSSSMMFPALVVVDVLSREVTENGTVIRDCTEVWCDVPRVGRMPQAVAMMPPQQQASSNFGRRVGVVAMDWTYLNTSSSSTTSKQNQSNKKTDQDESAASSTLVKKNASFSSVTANDMMMMTSSFYLNQTQQFAFDWSSLRPPGRGTHSDEATATQSLPWSSAPPRAVGPAMVRRPMLNEFSDMYDAALTRSAHVLYSLHPSQAVAVRGLRALVCDVSPAALRNTGAPLAVTTAAASQQQQQQDGNSNSNSNTGLDIVRAGARWVAKRHAAVGGSVYKKLAESQMNALKKFDAAAASESGDCPSFTRVARVVSQQPRCMLRGGGGGQEDPAMGVRCRLSIAPQVLKPVVKQTGRRLLLECALRLVVAFSAPPSSSASSSASSSSPLSSSSGGGGGGSSDSAVQQRVMTESLQAFQASDTTRFNVNEMLTVQQQGRKNVIGGSQQQQQHAPQPSSHQATAAAAPPPKKIVLEQFRVVISGSGFSPYTMPGQSPTARDGDPCVFHNVELKSSLSGTTINVPKGNAAIVWSFPAGATVNLNEDMALTGKVSLETVWPDERTASAVVDAVVTHAAKPFPMPPLNAQVEMLGFLDGDFVADDFSVSGSHVDAFSATCVNACAPSEGTAISNRSSGGQEETNKQQQQQQQQLPRWRSFSEALRNVILHGAAVASPSSSSSLTSCLLCASRAEVLEEENKEMEREKHHDDEDEDADEERHHASSSTRTSRIETLLPDWPSGFSTQHLAAAMGSQLGDLCQNVFHGTTAAGSDYSAVVPPTPKARVVACGPQWGSSFVVWNTAR